MMGGSEASEYADSGQSNDLDLVRWSVLSSPTHGRISQASVDSVFVVVVDVFAQQVMQVPLVHDDHVIEKLPASASDPSLGNPILPWTPKGRSLRFYSNVLDRLSDPF
jgi:hypothetical protein